MINALIQLLQMDDFDGVSENVDIAKGKYKLNTTVKESWKQAKRKFEWQKKG